MKKTLHGKRYLRSRKSVAINRMAKATKKQEKFVWDLINAGEAIRRRDWNEVFSIYIKQIEVVASAFRGLVESGVFAKEVEDMNKLIRQFSDCQKDVIIPPGE